MDLGYPETLGLEGDHTILFEHSINLKILFEIVGGQPFVRDVTPSLLQYFGLTSYEKADQLLGMIVAAIPPRQVTTNRVSYTFAERVGLVLRDGRQVFDTDFLVNDELTTFHCVMEQVPHPSGRTFIIGVLHKREEQEEQMRFLLDNIPFSVLLIDRQYNFIEFNKPACLLIGSPSKETFAEDFNVALGHLQLDGVPARKKFQTAVDLAFGIGEQNLQLSLAGADGEFFTCECTFRSSLWKKTETVIVFCRPLTQYDAAKREIFQSNDFLELRNSAALRLSQADHLSIQTVVSEVLAEICQLLGLHRGYVYQSTNDEYQKIFRWESEGFERSNFSQKVNATTNFPEVYRFLQQNKPFNGKIEQFQRVAPGYNPPDHAFSILLAPIPYQGQQWGFIVLDDCVHRRKFPESFEKIICAIGQLIASTHDRIALIESLKSARDEALHAAQVKSNFLARMSHEIRTPMNAIIGMTKLAQKHTATDPTRRHIDTIETSARQLMHVINNVLDMSKIDSGKLLINHDPFVLRDLLVHIGGVMQPQFSREKINFFISAAESTQSSCICSDELLISQVLINLLGNAVKFTEPGGDITLSVQLTPQQGKDPASRAVCLRCSVADTGCGIAFSALDKIFHPFEQADGSITRRFGGTGLGLSISKNIIEMMGGSICVESEEGQGTQFTFELPVVYGEAATVAETVQTSTFPGKTILLAEDIALNREVVCGLLEDTGVTIETAENGELAFSKFSQNPNRYDLILMDLQMPIMDGFTATKCIRALSTPRARQIPIIALTANAFKEDVDASLSVGMNGHLSKPIDFSKLMKILSTYLSD